MSDARAESSVLTLIRLGKIVETALAASGLTVNQYRLLTLVRSETPKLSELSVRLVMKPPNVSVVIDGLVKRGLLERRRHPTDGRRFDLRLTRSGHGALRAAQRSAGDALTVVAHEGGSEDVLFAALDGWNEVLDSVAADLRAASI